MSRYVIDMGDEKLDIRVGFDEGLLSYFLTIEDPEKGSEELEDYVFHNMRDVKGTSMTLEMVIEQLSNMGIKLPHTLTIELVRDATKTEYLNILKQQEKFDILESFKELCSQIVSGTSSSWNSEGKSPDCWECLDSGFKGT